MMKSIKPDIYMYAAILLTAAAVILITAALTTNLGEFVTAAFVISGTTCVMMGIFLITFTRSAKIEPRHLATLTSQWSKNISQIESDLGITGNAYFLPPRVTGESRVMQFNPTLTYSGSNVSAKDPITKTGAAGLIIPLCCEPWIQELKKRNALTIPDKEEELIVLMEETIGDVFEFASRVSGSFRDNTVTLTFHGYQFIDGCKDSTHESEDVCTMNPCPVCCLCGALIAEGTDKVVTLDQCTVNTTSREVTAVFSMVPTMKVISPEKHATSDAVPDRQGKASGPG